MAYPMYLPERILERLIVGCLQELALCQKIKSLYFIFHGKTNAGKEKVGGARGGNEHKTSIKNRDAEWKEKKKTWSTGETNRRRKKKGTAT